jgi:pimeloyl-ACP methyl ester carboxylesterase
MIGIGLAAAGVGTAIYNAAKARSAEASNPPLGQFVEVQGVRLHYLEEGSGKPIVLLHGNGTMIQDWQASGLFDALAKTNRVIAFDRPGFGHSERPCTTAWTPKAQADLIADAMAALSITDATVVGHSFGSMVAVRLGLDHSQIVAELVLISGYYYPSVRPDVVLAAPPAVPIVGDVIRYTVSPLIGAASRPVMEAQLFGPAEVSEGWRDDFPFEMTLRPSQIRASSADGAMMIPAAASSSARLAELTGKVTIIAGSGDLVVTPSEQSERLAKELPNGQLILIEGAGHMVHHSASTQVAAAIRNA